MSTRKYELDYSKFQKKKRAEALIECELVVFFQI